MEILQKIWNSLITENPSIINIISIPLIFIEVSISMLIFTTLLSIDVTKKQKWSYVLIVSIFSIISRLFIPNPFNAFINLLIMLLSVIFVFKTSIAKGILSVIIPFVVEILVEAFFSKIYLLIFKIDYVTGMNIPLHRLIGTLLIYLIMYGIYILLKVFKVNFAKIQVLNKKKKLTLLFNILFAIILIASELYIITFYTYALPTFITIINIISIFAYVVISFYTIFTVSKLESTSMNLEEAQLYNKTLQMLQDNTRAFRHDFSNIVQGMAGFIDKNDMEGLKKYYYQLLEDIQHTNNLTSLSPSVVNNPAIYNVLATKYHKADELGIKINLEAFLNMNDLNIKIYEFTRVLGILMDNAIEAAKECDDKIINVTFRKDSRKHMQLLIIENTYTNKDVNTDKIFEKGYSTKKGNTGLGLWEVRQILKKNDNLNLFTTKNSEFFIQQFEIFY
mgnify:CR=1 FL=1